MPNLQKTLLDKIFRPKRFKRIISTREQIKRIEKMYDDAYMHIGLIKPECLMRYNQVRRVIDEQELFKLNGETEVLFQLVQYRDTLIDITRDTDLDISDILYEVRREKLENLNI